MFAIRQLYYRLAETHLRVMSSDDNDWAKGFS